MKVKRDVMIDEYYISIFIFKVKVSKICRVELYLEISLLKDFIELDKMCDKFLMDFSFFAHRFFKENL